MSQVMQVDFVNTSTMQNMHTSFTKSATHKEAIDLAMHEWSGGTSSVTEAHRLAGTEPQLIPGPAKCWKHLYRCALAPTEDDPVEREVVAVLFTTYKEEYPK